jgi:3-oxoacyl-[acyl-carrier protein] reductase
MFNGKVALVTGGSRGIGAAICKDLAARGAYVYINYVRNKKAAQAVLSQITAAGGQAALAQASVSDARAVGAMFQAIRKNHARLDILVNNAAVTRDACLGMMSDQDWREVLETNLTGAFLCSRAAVKMMIAQHGGQIVNLGSISGVAGRAGQCNYAAAKAGLVAFTRSLALEVSAYRIRVNCVIPGCIETDLGRKMPEALRRKMLASHPLGRMGRPEEVAAVVRFLLSDDAAYIQGQAIVVDGGLIHP